MKKIFLQMSSPIFANNGIFKRKDWNNASFRWCLLKDKLKALGYELVTADDRSLKDCEGIIFLDANSLYGVSDTKTKIKNSIKKLLGIKITPNYPTRNLYQEAVEAGLKDKMVLIMHEGKSSCPLNFSPKIWGKFNRIMTWDDEIAKNPKFTQYLLPMENPDMILEIVPFDQKKLLVNMSVNKYSPYKHELYSARRKSIAYFNKNYPDDFDLYGTRWNEPVTRLKKHFPFLVKKYASYRGWNENKTATLSKYKFNICYENNSDAKGYITEKIFDSLHARIVPIYWGASNIEQYVDQGVFIDRRKFKGEKELAEFISKMTEEEYQKYIDAGLRYMKSEKYARFLPETFCNSIIKALNLK